ncbi:MAG: FecR domain-containing protein [Tannerellaceae bacterium]|jgi:ferric-dicitrate binding protein FerR (iron transport regulator)|nr:FecR domain-containing protein [Tannerellaceae bacterium]
MNKDLLHKYFAGETTPEEEKEIMDWTELSADNYRSYLKERKGWNALLVNTDLQPIPQMVRHKRSVNPWIFSTVAASVALLIALSQWFIPAKQSEEKWQSIWVPPGQRAQVTLDDGTTVWLNSQSTLHFPASFRNGRRIVELNGEGFFDVEENKEQPFIVHTKKYDIEVLGTNFNVLAYKDHEVFEVSLLSGSVQIHSSESTTPEVILKPNQKVIESSGRLQVEPIDNFEHFRWREGLICLDDERFEELIKKFSLYFDIRITVENPQFLEYRCTGKFRQSDGVDYALRVLQRKMKFNYIRDNESNEIVIK